MHFHRKITIAYECISMPSFRDLQLCAKKDLKVYECGSTTCKLQQPLTVPPKPFVVHRGPRIPVWEPLVLAPERWATPEGFEAFETSKCPRGFEEINFLHYDVKASMGHKLRALSISFTPLNRYCFMLHLRYHSLVTDCDLFH